MHRKLFVLLILFILPGISWAVKTQVKLIAGGDNQVRGNLEKVLTNVLNGVNRNHEIKSPLAEIRHNFTDEAFEDFSDLIKHTQLYASEKEYRTYLLKTQMGFYEVRDIKVRIFLGATEGLPYQNLVFVIDKNGRIVNVHFALKKHHYDKIIRPDRKLDDLRFREKILHFIELYRTAYNKKDLDFVRKTLSEDALIIVGLVVKTQKADVDYLSTSYLDEEKIEFIRMGKYEYLEKLSKVFKNNDFVRVLFDEITIQRHPQFNKIYGVQLKQRWNSSSYADEGHLFLLVDFFEPEEPMIHVRAWQPEKFTDGSVINLFDFEVIE